MVEYAVLVAETSLATFGSFIQVSGAVKWN